LKNTIAATVVLIAALLANSEANAQQPAAPSTNPLDVVPDKMPFSNPYGPPISAQRAQAPIQAAMAEATKHDWPMNIAVYDSGANLVAFLRMDGALLASIAVAEHKARAAVNSAGRPGPSRMPFKSRTTNLFCRSTTSSQPAEAFRLSRMAKSSGPLVVPAEPAHRMKRFAWPAPPRSISKVQEHRLPWRPSAGEFPARENR
jgi:uncharacterized protein GlcG (DUF336 family)